jgi:hypothetical protein
MLSIDFGSAYTKVGIRRSLERPSKLIEEESLILDDQHVCIPTLAAVAERNGKERWAFGPAVTEIASGNGIQVYRNWKSQLFTAARPSGVAAQLTGAVRGKPTRRRAVVSSPSPFAGDTDLDVKAVTLRYFTWLREFLAAPSARLGVRDLGVVPVRLSVPAFGSNGRAMNDYSPSEQLLLEILGEAGWNVDDECPIVLEPESNAVGIYSQGQNFTWSPQGSRGKKYLHFQKMFIFGGYLPALRRRSLRRDEQSRHHVLVVDIGAFTTDLALLEFDLDNEEKPPVGVQQVDDHVLSILPSPKAARIIALPARQREELKRALYVAESSYRLEGNTTIGDPGEAEQIHDCVDHFAETIRLFIENFLGEADVTQVHELIFTGGGNLIPRVCAGLINSILQKRIGVSLVHAPSSVSSTPNSQFHLDQLASAIVRGSSGIGGASVYFEKRFW